MWSWADEESRTQGITLQKSLHEDGMIKQGRNVMQSYTALAGQNDWCIHINEHIISYKKQKKLPAREVDDTTVVPSSGAVGNYAKNNQCAQRRDDCAQRLRRRRTVQ